MVDVREDGRASYKNGTAIQNYNQESSNYRLAFFILAKQTLPSECTKHLSSLSLISRHPHISI